MEKESSSEFAETLSEMYDLLSSGLSYTHTRINFNTTKTLESSSFLYALVELLNEKGLISKMSQCTVHESRPVPCRGFDCKDNEKWKVWTDYEKKIINLELNEQLQKGSKSFFGGQR